MRDAFGNGGNQAPSGARFDADERASGSGEVADLDEPVRRAVIAVLVAVGAGLLSGAAGLPTVVGVALPTGVLVVAAAAVGSRHYAAATSIRDNAPLSSATELARRTNEPTTA